MVFLTFINLANVGFIFYDVSNLSVAIDVAGRNRMLSQQLALFANLHVNGKPEAEAISQSAIELHDQSVTALKYGGEAPQLDKKKLSPVTGEAMDVLLEIEENWKPFKENALVVLDQPTYLVEFSETDEVPIIDPVDSLAPIEPKVEKIKTLNPKVKASLDYLSSHATSMLAINNDLVKVLLKQAQAEESRLFLFLISGALLSIIVLVFGYFTLNPILFKPLQSISQTSILIAKGDYNQTIQYDGNNELSILSSSLNTVFVKFKKASAFVNEFGKGDHSAEFTEFHTDENYRNDSFIKSLVDTQMVLRESDIINKRRNWTNEGLAKFSDILRSNHINLQELGRTIITQLTDYIKAYQGGIFVLNDTNANDKHLEMIACYAYTRVKHITHRIEIGEGLLGEVFQESIMRYITVIPKGYTSINTGLGDAVPACILIVPLKINEEVLGVLEIASFQKLEPHEIEFVEKIAETIASTLSAAKINQITKELFDQSQMQSEAMRAQEEEMRQNMEELQATQEEMIRKEREYLARIAELEQKEEV